MEHRHPQEAQQLLQLRHEQEERTATVMLSVCGFPEDSEFDALSEFIHRTRHKDVTIAAEIYRAAAEALTNPRLKDKADDILAATKSADRELVESMKISPETMATYH